MSAPLMSGFGKWWRRNRVERDLDAEFAYHIDRETETCVAAGVPPEDARRRALRSFGPMDKHRADVREARGISWFDEGKWTLNKRVEQILTGVHYAEEPLSRVCHMVSNVQILDIRDEGTHREVDVRSRFLVYQNRVEYETYFFVGKRKDTLRLTEDGWKIARREIILDQNVLLAKNLTTFF